MLSQNLNTQANKHILIILAVSSSFLLIPTVQEAFQKRLINAFLLVFGHSRWTKLFEIPALQKPVEISKTQNLEKTFKTLNGLVFSVQIMTIFLPLLAAKAAEAKAINQIPTLVLMDDNEKKRKLAETYPLNFVPANTGGGSSGDSGVNLSISGGAITVTGDDLTPIIPKPKIIDPQAPVKEAAKNIAPNDLTQAPSPKRAKLTPPATLDLSAVAKLIKNAYAAINIKLTLPADANDKIKTQLIMLYNLKERWTPEAKDLIKSITVGEDGRLIVNISKGDLELKAGSCHKMNGNVYLTGIFLVNADYSYYGTNDYGCTQIIQIIPVLLNLSREELNKFDVNWRFNIFEQMKTYIIPNMEII